MSLDTNLAIAGIVLALVGIGIPIRWPNQKWIGTLCLVLAGAVVVLWAGLAIRSNNDSAAAAAISIPVAPVFSHAEAVLSGITIVPRLPTSGEVFPAIFEFRTKDEIRAFRISMSVKSMLFERGVRGYGYEIAGGQIHEEGPVGSNIAIQFAPPAVFKEPSGRLSWLIDADVIVRLILSIPGEAGRYFVEGDFKLEGELHSQRRWDLVSELRRGNYAGDH